MGEIVLFLSFTDFLINSSLHHSGFASDEQHLDHVVKSPYQWLASGEKNRLGQIILLYLFLFAFYVKLVSNLCLQKIWD